MLLKISPDILLTCVFPFDKKATPSPLSQSSETNSSSLTGIMHGGSSEEISLGGVYIYIFQTERCQLSDVL